MKGPNRYLEITFVTLIILVTLGGCASNRTQGMVQAYEYRRISRNTDDRVGSLLISQRGVPHAGFQSVSGIR